MASLSFNGDKSEKEAFYWYRKQQFYDPRRAMAIRTWMDGDLPLALRLLKWVEPKMDIRTFSSTQKSNENWNIQAA